MIDEEIGGYGRVSGIGDLYDHTPVYGVRQDVAFYVDAARAAAGPVLEVGCGTGRVLIPTARAGATITGIDLAFSMLDRCAARVAQEPEDVRARITLERADMRGFDLGRRYALATIPFRPLQHLVAVDDQLECLRSIRRHLEPGGRLVFDVFNPDPARLLVPDEQEAEDTPPTPLGGGRSFRRTVRVVEVHRVEQWNLVDIAYYVTEPEGTEGRHVLRFPMRWFVPAELVHLLARAGFRIDQLYGNFDRSPLVDTSPEIIVVATAEE
jgi:SAM-dependent methyltransferase